MKRIDVPIYRLTQSVHVILEAYSTTNFLIVNKTLLRYYGLEMAVFISNLVDKLRFFYEKELLTPEGGFYLTHAQQVNETGLSEFRVMACKKQLISAGILTTQMQGMPAKEIYFLNAEALLKSLAVPVDTRGLVPVDTRGLVPVDTRGLVPVDTRGLTLYNNNKVTNNKVTNNKVTNNKVKEKNTKKEKFVDDTFFLSLFPKNWQDDPEFEKAIINFSEHRTAIKKKLTPLAMELLAKKLLRENITTVIEALNISIESGWAGVFPRKRSHGKPAKNAAPIVNPNKYLSVPGGGA